jgi:hypothetical protein
VRPAVRQHIRDGSGLRQLQQITGLAGQILQHPEEKNAYSHEITSRQCIAAGMIQ